MKTEPSVFSYDDFKKAPSQRTCWEGVRNFQARNFLRDQMKPGDLVFIYHSSCEVPGIYGIGKIASDAYPDPTAFKKGSEYYDDKPLKKGEQARWYTRDVEAVKKLDPPYTLADIKANRNLASMLVIKRGMRLSIQPVTEKEWKEVLKAAGFPA